MNNLYWLRNDLRLNDNMTLEAYYPHRKTGKAFWCSNKTYSKAKPSRKNFIDSCIDSHFNNLKKLEINTEKSDMPVIDYLNVAISKHKISRFYFTSAHSFDEINEEKNVIQFCLQHHIEYFFFDQNTLIEETKLPFSLNQMPLVFTDFRKKVEAQLSITLPCNIFSHISLGYHDAEASAIERVYNYIWKTKSILTYKETRNGMINFNDSSKFSPWLSLGVLSARTIYSEIKKFESQYGANESTYWLFFELLWRDYFKFLSKKNGAAFFLLSGIKKEPIKREGINFNQQLFNDWCNGETPEDFINANMIELKHTGFMSNRGRQNVASYLIHNLRLPWTWGASYFEEQLIDYDPESNWGNWLYLSGQGSDPRSRVFNIQKQAMDYDPKGEYQKKWLNR